VKSLGRHLPLILVALGAGLVATGYGLLPLQQVQPTSDYPFAHTTLAREDPRAVWAYDMAVVGWCLVIVGLGLRARSPFVWILAGVGCLAVLVGGPSGLGGTLIALTVGATVVVAGWPRSPTAIVTAGVSLGSWVLGAGAGPVGEAPLGGWLILLRTVYPIALATLLVLLIGPPLATWWTQRKRKATKSLP
jgi:hypothetical protein